MEVQNGREMCRETEEEEEGRFIVWIQNHNMCKNMLLCVHSSVHPHELGVALFSDVCSCLYRRCAEHIRR